MMKLWMVRSGSGGRWADECRERSIVGLGWRDAGDPNGYSDKRALQAALLDAFDYTEGQAASGASQLWRFRTEVNEGDGVITYDSGSRLYHYGTISGPAVFVPTDIEQLSYQRAVAWAPNSISRDELSDDARNRLGSVLTLFLVPDRTANELRSKATGETSTPTEDRDSADEVIDPFETVIEEARLRIGDAVAELNWRDMQHLVAAVLRAMDYKTEVSVDGSDRGRDIVASPDGFGFEQPRIIVEVKHRPGEKMDAPALRSFLGGRHKDDRGLYVSTGGFTKDAYYEADRSNIPLKLMTLDELARAIIDNYEKFDSEGRAILPLKKMFWPA